MFENEAEDVELLDLEDWKVIYDFERQSFESAKGGTFDQF